MNGRYGRCGVWLIGGICFALGILAALILPNLLIVIILTMLLLLFCVLMMK